MYKLPLVWIELLPIINVLFVGAILISILFVIFSIYLIISLDVMSLAEKIKTSKWVIGIGMKALEIVIV